MLTSKATPILKVKQESRNVQINSTARSQAQINPRKDLELAKSSTSRQTLRNLVSSHSMTAQSKSPLRKVRRVETYQDVIANL